MTAIYDLVELATGEIVGELTDAGEVRSADPSVVDRVNVAFGRELLVRDGEVIEELGVCFSDVETVRPGDPHHARLVVMNLAALARLLPRPQPGQSATHPAGS